MKIYIAHSKKIDYINDLYIPLRNDSFFYEYELILPHEKSESSSNDREFYKNIDVFIAECSESTIGLGIELGWVYDDCKNIYCIYKSGKRISNAIKVLTHNFFEYESTDEMLEVIRKIVEEEKKKRSEKND